MIDPDAYQRAVDALPSRTREVFLLHCLGDLSYAQIAERLSISIGTVQSELANALCGIDRMLTEWAASDHCAAPADAIRMKQAYRRWRLWWRLRHWRSWFLASVDHDDMQAHAEYVLCCLPRLSREIYIAFRFQDRTSKQVREWTGLSDAAIRWHFRRAVRHVYQAERLRPCTWTSGGDGA